MANSVDPDQMLHSAASDLCLHCLLRRVCLCIKGKYSNAIILKIYKKKNKIKIGIDISSKLFPEETICMKVRAYFWEI